MPEDGFVLGDFVVLLDEEAMAELLTNCNGELSGRPEAKKVEGSGQS